MTGKCVYLDEPKKTVVMAVKAVEVAEVNMKVEEEVAYVATGALMVADMDIVESVSWEEPVLGVYGGNNENAPRVGSEPTNSQSLGGHLIHYTTAIVYTDAYYAQHQPCVNDEISSITSVEQKLIVFHFIVP
ncbi:hypothetical protein DPMN_067632 [Dreissena polymorpha]|uniref:Uncharacterized protein n=1 Tax=Dreissena polymorpha TaxID=45954 RepID=A0A9D3YZJ8_DREPO|nr:hypothetical protein DPMN_067632 [Dreissena polymorpha]